MKAILVILLIAAPLARESAEDEKTADTVNLPGENRAASGRTESDQATLDRQEPALLYPTIGITPKQAETALGTPTLELYFHESKQQQFAQGDCILDIHFHADRQNGNYRAIFIEARNKQGQAMQPGQCIDQQMHLRHPRLPIPESYTPHERIGIVALPSERTSPEPIKDQVNIEN